MKNVFLTLLAIIFLSQSGISQIPKPAETPKPAVDDDIVKISSNLIQIDVTVTGKGGAAVSDLTIDDFEIYENGQKQDITNFSYISAGARSVQTTEKSVLKSDVPLTSKVRPEQVRRTIALIVDDLTLSWESAHFVRRALRKFVETQMEDGDLVAIIRTGAGIGALQQFTTDKRMLLAAIEKVQWNPLGSGGISPFAPIESGFANELSTDEESDEDTVDPQAELNDFRETLFATGTLGAVNYVIRGMKDLPGRKSVMLLSDGFSLFSETSDGFRESNRVMDALRLLVDLANRSSVVVYTLDARGLQYTGLTAADNVSGLTSDQIQKTISDRNGKLFDTQEGLVYLARQTGGLPIINNNDISGGIRKVLDDQSYYLIGYQPDSETFDPAKRRFNRLEVKVKRKDVNVRYRSGFFGTTDDKMTQSPNLTSGQKILLALSSPFGVNDINLSLNTLFRADPQQNTSLSSFVNINVADLTFKDAPGGKEAKFDIVAISFGDNGTVMDEISKSYTINITADKFEQFLKEKFVYFFTFPVKKPGAYQMRVAIRDHANDKLGSASQFIEVPKLSKKRMTLSGIVLEGFTVDQWINAESSTEKQITNPMADTANRIFKRGSVLRYGLEVYNAKTNGTQIPQLKMFARVYRDGKVYFEGEPKPVDFANQGKSNILNAVGALALGEKMLPGDYVLQVVVIDPQAKSQSQTATQLVQFEIAE